MDILSNQPQAPHHIGLPSPKTAVGFWCIHNERLKRAHLGVEAQKTFPHMIEHSLRVPRLTKVRSLPTARVRWEESSSTETTRVLDQTNEF